jgi:hypothetical protein
MNNERDPEFKDLFDLLASSDMTISKKSLVDIIFQFELPIRIEEFFLPIGKKDTLNFSDFCLLFKSGEKEDVFLKSFSGAGSFQQASHRNILDESNISYNDNIFPVTVTKFRRSGNV